METENWEELYKSVEGFIRGIRGNNVTVEKNVKAYRGGIPFVYVNFPKRTNTIAIMELDRDKNCMRVRGFNRDGKLYCRYIVRAMQQGEK